MSRKAISITLEEENLLWLRGQARAGGRRNVSQLVDRLVSDARAAGRVHADSIRSVVGTIALATADPDLAGADRTIRRMFSSGRRRRVRQSGRHRG
ncbi:MAG: hypothetical protein E6J83_16560 [Deltaproteobacteria bacterium]|nr:MAG: hypothetical protein E6J83_16560 [Deltaproteobacteria bacterium]